MNTQSTTNWQNFTVSHSERSRSEYHDFDFDQWAKQVRQQMIAALRRRGAE